MCNGTEAYFRAKDILANVLAQHSHTLAKSEEKTLIQEAHDNLTYAYCHHRLSMKGAIAALTSRQGHGK